MGAVEIMCRYPEELPPPPQPPIPRHRNGRRAQAGSPAGHTVGALNPVKPHARLPPVVAGRTVKVMPQARRKVLRGPVYLGDGGAPVAVLEPVPLPGVQSLEDQRTMLYAQIEDIKALLDPRPLALSLSRLTGLMPPLRSPGAASRSPQRS